MVSKPLDRKEAFMKEIFDLQSLTIKIPRVLLQWVDAQCKEGGRTRTDVVRDAANSIQ